MALAAADTVGEEYGRILQEGLANGVELGGFDAAVELTVPGRQSLPALVDCLGAIRQRAG